MFDQESQPEMVDGSLLRGMDKLDIGKRDSPAPVGVKRRDPQTKTSITSGRNFGQTDQ